MPYAQPFIKINALGTFGSTSTVDAEFWQAGFHIIKPSGLATSTAQIEIFLAAISALTSTLHGNATLSAGNKCWLKTLNGAFIGTDGKYVLGALQPTALYTYGSPVAGGGTGGSPWSQALVFTLRSVLLRGPASHGRIYWPATGLDVDANTGALSGTQTALIKAAVKTWIDGVNAQAATTFGDGAVVGCVSQVGAGAQSPVVQVGIGQRLDHMESRERNTPEAYSTVAPAVAAAYLDERERDFRERVEDLDDVGRPSAP